MNRLLADPLQSVGLPEVIEDFLEHGFAECCAFNSRGTLLASGCRDGQIVIWDFETRGVARALRGHKGRILSLGWSSNGRALFSAGADQTIAEWDVADGRLISTAAIDNTVTGISVSRGDARSVCVSCASGPPLLLSLSGNTRVPIPVAHLDGPQLVAGTAAYSEVQNCSAVFSWDGALIFVAAMKGCICVVSAASLSIVDIVKVGSTSRILGMKLSRKGKFLLVRSSDRAIRLFEVKASTSAAPDEPKLEEIRRRAEAGQVPDHGSVLGASGALELAGEFRNSVDKMQWKAMDLSPSMEFIAAAVLSKTEHHTYVWNRCDRQLEVVLEGPDEGIAWMEWHPHSCILLTVSAANGKIYIWSKIYTENWSAFAPDFKELQENTEYVEREDEFDLEPDKPMETDPGPTRDMSASEEELDVFTRDSIKVFSSDDEDGILAHLPITADDVKDDLQRSLLVEVEAKAQDDTAIEPRETLVGEDGGNQDGPDVKRAKQ
uniref:COMPASS component SWD1 n=2 Tax=Tetraselmis sp. GSL018 TaxID=582737 RepID=A0A061RBP4_9CHLO|eukprot:CAMPEP_0177588844 /NCGR_PEP_ID=MMETSP0419_2-20121207/6458_1 /TAXON_ID=582737 /ORGANISM="Tetraselmis sp., Strain GSL018" /LENGTH=491 /DNA_ID=CAMNT_0019079101 /DNA_START=213 /DNA_END=1688 /DNA_ORIENTATION=+